LRKVELAKKVYGGRYAQGVFEIALERKELKRWQSDLSKMASLSKDAAFVAALESPKFPLEAKVKLLSEQLGEMNRLALNLACLLVARGRFSLVSKIADEYQRLLDIYYGIEPAEVVTAIPLSDADMQKLSERLSGVTGKKVVLKPEVDSSLIGGIIARVGGKLIDGSTRSQLQALKREVAGTRG